MSDTRFTPGPWVADHFDEGDWLVRAHGTDTVVAESPAGIPGLSIGESHAIGNIVAAAPDMYEAILQVLHADACGFDGMMDSALSNARAAIAKAEGRDY